MHARRSFWDDILIHRIHNFNLNIQRYDHHRHHHHHKDCLLQFNILTCGLIQIIFFFLDRVRGVGGNSESSWRPPGPRVNIPLMWPLPFPIWPFTPFIPLIPFIPLTPPLLPFTNNRPFGIVVPFNVIASVDLGRDNVDKWSCGVIQCLTFGPPSTEE